MWPGIVGKSLLRIYLNQVWKLRDELEGISMDLQKVPLKLLWEIMRVLGAGLHYLGAWNIRAYGAAK